jgi:hypothetical protein
MDWLLKTSFNQGHLLKKVIEKPKWIKEARSYSV